MMNLYTVLKTGNASRRLTMVSGLFVLLTMLFVQPALADEPATGAEKCVECHQSETEAWQASSHANAPDMIGATCEDCHGKFKESHPDSAIMRLNIGPEVCAECHKQVLGAWEQSKHAENNVQCSGCHLSHSQEFRLTDDRLCDACHKERLADIEHTTHDLNGVVCIDCHVEPHISSAASENTEVANHDYTQVLVDNCIECHQGDVHTGLPNTQAADIHVVEMAERVPDLTNRLETAEQENKSLLIMTPVAMGIGIGLGGVLGIIFMLVVGSLNRRRGEQ